MKLIYHHRTLGDGAEGIHIREMIAAFRSLGHEVKVVAPVGENYPNDKGGGSQNTSRGVMLATIKSRLPGLVFELCEMGYSLFIFLVLTWKCLLFRPNFIYDRYITFNIGGILAAKLTGTPLCLEVNAPLALERSEQPDERLYFRKIAFWFERLACTYATKTIVVSTPLKNYLLDQGVPEDKIVVMPNGVNPDKFYPHPKNQDLLLELDIPIDRIVIGFTGVLRAWHGLDLLLEAFRRVVEKHEKVFLLIVGDGPIRGELERLIKSYSLDGKVLITGRVAYEKVHEYVNLFDIAVSPKATFYASPMKVVEYMGLGKIVVVPNNPNFLDLIDSDVDGFVFGDQNTPNLVDGLLAVFENHQRFKMFGENAVKKVENRLNWQWNAKYICSMIK